MYSCEGTTCRMTRGDNAIFKMDFTRPDGTTYRPGPGQELRFRIKPSAGSETILLDRPEVCDGRFYILAEDTADWLYGSYTYEIVQVTDGVEEILFGPYVFKVEQEVTY